MKIPKPFIAILLAALPALLASCAKGFQPDDYTAYFGGEVTNRTGDYVLLYRGDELVDSIQIGRDNRFFRKFDSLAPGMYTFRHDPEYQYVYFDKNDSLMVTINSRDFDESIVFSGRGDQKNNFLMEFWLRNEKDRDNMFPIYELDLRAFNRAIDSVYKSNSAFYIRHKQDLKWHDGFDRYARALLDFPHYSRKELYPLVHHMRTGNDVVEQLPPDYYAFRRNIDFNNAELSGYSPFVRYLSFMLNNMADINYHNHFSQQDLALKTNTNKLIIADTLIKNAKIRNSLLNNIAFNYLLEDQNAGNNQKFLETYNRLSTDRAQKQEILEIGRAINALAVGKKLPPVTLVDAQGKEIASDEVARGKCVIFFWTENAAAHLVESHKKVIELRKRYPEYKYIAVNLDPNHQQWRSMLEKYNFGPITELRCKDFDKEVRIKWAITKIHRTIVLDSDSTIKNAFTNLFDNGFEQNLEK